MSKRFSLLVLTSLFSFCLTSPLYSASYSSETRIAIIVVYDDINDTIDVLQEFVIRGHAKGLKVFAYVNCYLVTDGKDTNSWLHRIGFFLQAVRKKYGANYRYRSCATISDAATWNVTLPSSGSWEVYACWTSGTNRATAAPYIVYYSGIRAHDKCESACKRQEMELSGNEDHECRRQ